MYFLRILLFFLNFRPGSLTPSEDFVASPKEEHPWSLRVEVLKRNAPSQREGRVPDWGLKARFVPY
jgi:hypothetical protein